MIAKLSRMLCILLVGLTARGGLADEPLAHEGFSAADVSVGADLDGYDRASTGFDGAWMKPKDGMTASFVDGLSLGGLRTAGLAASFHRDDSSVNSIRYFARPVDFAVSDGALWISYLTRWTEDNGGKGHGLNVGLGTFTHIDDHDMAVHTLPSFRAAPASGHLPLLRANRKAGLDNLPIGLRAGRRPIPVSPVVNRVAGGGVGVKRCCKPLPGIINAGRMQKADPMRVGLCGNRGDTI